MKAWAAAMTTSLGAPNANNTCSGNLALCSNWMGMDENLYQEMPHWWNADVQWTAKLGMRNRNWVCLFSCFVGPDIYSLPITVRANIGQLAKYMDDHSCPSGLCTLDVDFLRDEPVPGEGDRIAFPEMLLWFTTGTILEAVRKCTPFWAIFLVWALLWSDLLLLLSF